MSTNIVTCDACGVKNRIDTSKTSVPRCGKCKNPLGDAIEEQLHLNLSGNEEVDLEDFDGAGEEEEEGDEEDEEDSSKYDPLNDPRTPDLPSDSDEFIKSMFGETPCKMKCPKCGDMFIALGKDHGKPCPKCDPPPPPKKGVCYVCGKKATSPNSDVMCRRCEAKLARNMGMR